MVIGSQQLLNKAVFQWHQKTRARNGNYSVHAPPRIITLSRQLGSGGRRVAEVLARCLEWPLWDKEIIKMLADQSRMHYMEGMLAELDERVQSEIEAIIYSLCGHPDHHAYFFLLPRAILTIAQNDAIILGRAAHLWLPENTKVLRVRIIASADTRVHNLMHYERNSEREARARIKASDRERDDFLAEVARRTQRKSAYDLTVNTDRLEVLDAASMIVEAVKPFFDLKMGEYVSPESLKY